MHLQLSLEESADCVYVALIENQFSNRVRLFLALMFNITEHAIQFGVLLVHLLQTFLSDPFLGFQIHKAAALLIKASLHVLRDSQKKHMCIWYTEGSTINAIFNFILFGHDWVLERIEIPLEFSVTLKCTFYS